MLPLTLFCAVLRPGLPANRRVRSHAPGIVAGSIGQFGCGRAVRPSAPRCCAGTVKLHRSHAAGRAGTALAATSFEPDGEDMAAFGRAFGRFLLSLCAQANAGEAFGSQRQRRDNSVNVRCLTFAT